MVSEIGMIFLDTDVLIDLIRGHEPAWIWLESQQDMSFVLPGMTAMELIVGVKDGVELERVGWYLNSMNVVEPTDHDFRVALDLARLHVLHSGLGISDYLNAAQVLNRGSTLYTFNQRHFAAIGGLATVQPYSR